MESTIKKAYARFYLRLRILYRFFQPGKKKKDGGSEYSDGLILIRRENNSHPSKKNH
jgi:hypothetical protein